VLATPPVRVIRPSPKSRHGDPAPFLIVVIAAG
jgi:hypothetical protein